MLTFKSSFLISQIVTAMVAVMENSATLDLAAWPSDEVEDGKFECDAMIDCQVRLKGFEESHGVDRVTVRFDIVFRDCTFNEKESSYEWDEKSVSVWGGGCDHNLTFENSEGGNLHTYGTGGFLEKFDNGDDADITETIIDKVFETLSADAKSALFKDAFRGYNKMIQSAKQEKTGDAV